MLDSLEAESFRKQFGDVSLLRSLCSLEEDRRVGPKFINDLAARPARRTRHSPIVDDRDRPDLDLGAKLRDCRENRGSLRAVAHSVGGILHIAPREYFAVREENGGPYPETRVRCVRILHHLLRGPQKFGRYARGQCFLWHSD